MPIYGLTDQTPSFKEIGRLRLGIPKSEAATSGPKEIGYFRADFRPDALQAFIKFTDAYKDKPTEINFRLPFNEIERCWDAYYEVYNTSGMLGKADGKRWLYLRNNKTGELLVNNGVPMQPGNYPQDESGMPYMPFDKDIPVYSYQNKKGVDVGVFAKPTGRLKVFVPECQQAGFVQVITHSVYNIMRISAQLAGIKEIAKNAGMILPHVPMVLSRRLEQISVNINGKKAQQEHYLLNIEVNQDWSAAQFALLDRLLPGTTMPVLALPEPTIEEIAEDDAEPITEDTGELTDEEKQAIIDDERYEWAKNMTTGKGAKFETLLPENLQSIIDNAEEFHASEDQVNAANIILARLAKMQ
jgi:hypothetical protein